MLLEPFTQLIICMIYETYIIGILVRKGSIFGSLCMFYEMILVRMRCEYIGNNNPGDISCINFIKTFS